MNSNVWFRVFENVKFSDYKSCVMAIPLFREYLQWEDVVWRVLYAKIWKGEEDIDVDEIFWYMHLPTLKGNLRVFHQNLQDRVHTIFELHDSKSTSRPLYILPCNNIELKLLDHPLSSKLFIPISETRYILNTEILTTVVRCFIIFMHLEDVCSFNGFYVKDMWDLLRECVTCSVSNFSNSITQSKASFERI